jgi:hypothetical protein
MYARSPGVKVGSLRGFEDARKIAERETKKNKARAE